MAMQLGAHREALLNPEDVVLANKAAEEVVGYHSDLGTLRADMKSEFAGIRGEMTLLKWMLGTVLAGVLAIALKLFLK